MLTLQIKNNFVCHIPTSSNLSTKSNRFSVFQFRYTCIYTQSTFIYDFDKWKLKNRYTIYDVYVIISERSFI